MSLNGKAIEAEKTYKVAGWAPVSEAARDAGGEPIWDLLARHLRAKKTIPTPKLNLPQLKNVNGNLGFTV
jgi:sulfur-oxidizing protein SoxB